MRYEQKYLYKYITIYACSKDGTSTKIAKKKRCPFQQSCLKHLDITCTFAVAFLLLASHTLFYNSLRRPHIKSEMVMILILLGINVTASFQMPHQIKQGYPIVNGFHIRICVMSMRIHQRLENGIQQVTHSNFRYRNSCWSCR